MIDLSVPQRQSPLAIVFLGVRILRSLGIAQIVVVVLFILRAPFNGALSVMPFVIIVVFAGFSALAWWRYTFQVLDDELVVTKGILRVVCLNVPIERIQSIVIEQQLLHRLTDLVKVAVDTAGSNEAEFSIDAVTRPVAEELQRRAVTAVPTPVKIGGALPPPVLAPDRVVFTHDGRRLLAMALTMWPLAGLLVLGPLLAFGSDLFNQLPDVGLGDQPFRWWWVPVGIAGFIVFSIVLNITRVFLQDWELSLRASDTSLQRTSGLLSKTSTASNVNRIQMVTSTQNPLQRRAGLRGIELATVGQRNLSVDGCDDAQFTTVLSLAAVTPIGEMFLSRRIHPAAIWLAVRNTAVACALLTGPLFWLVGWWSLLVLSSIPLVWATTRLNVSNFRWGLGQQLASASHVFSWRTEQALLHKTNAITVTQSIFERRRGLGRVQLSTASGVISIGMIPIEEAHAARDTILHAVETDTRPWI